MPALDFRAFAAGFATQAQKIEEESAKIGMDLLKKAMEDFREEAKDYKPKYEDEIRNKKEQATYLRSTFGLSDTQVKVLLDRGDLGVKDFVSKAEKAKSFQQLEDYKGLVRLAEAQEPITGFDVIDYIDSGAYVKTKAPVYVGPEGFKTSVFGREVSLGDKSTVESTKSAYIPEKGGYEGDVPSTMGAKVDLTSELQRGEFAPIKRVEAKDFQAQFATAVGLYAGTSPIIDNNNNFRFSDSRAGAETKLKQDAYDAYKQWVANYKESGEEVDPSTIQDFALSYVTTLNDNEMEKGTSADKLFYKQAVGQQSVGKTTGSTQAAPPTVSSTGATSPPPANAPKAKFTQQTFLADPSVDKFMNPPMNTPLNKLDRRKQISLIAQSKYGLDKATADNLAEKLLP